MCYFCIVYYELESKGLLTLVSYYFIPFFDGGQMYGNIDYNGYSDQ